MNNCKVNGELGIGNVCDSWDAENENCNRDRFCELQIPVDDPPTRMITVTIELYHSQQLYATVGRDMEILNARVDVVKNTLELIGKDDGSGLYEQITIASYFDGEFVPGNMQYLDSCHGEGLPIKHFFLVGQEG
ncbi:MAG: hypothetical protein JRJ45_00355 [Deltaproteobacteria bacterium]|nr:hypothetical protein [Deltaproteobacteria bacterium]